MQWSGRNTKCAIASVVLAELLIGCSHGGPATYQGYVEGKFVYVASSESGRLDRLFISRGDTVTVGQSLFWFEQEPEASAKRQAEQALRSSESKLADLETGKRPEEINVTRAQLAEALAQDKQADSILKSDEAQYHSGGIPQTELIDAQASAEMSTARVQELKASLEVAFLPAREQQIRAQLEQVAADRATVAEAEWRLEQKQVSAPLHGLVFDLLYREGEWVSAGNPVVEILPPENRELRFFVPETVVGKLHIGEGISVRCDGCSAVIPAKVTYISPQSEYSPPLIYSNENRSKLVFLIIAKPPVDRASELHPGQPIEISLE